jgi:signal transduction histidine kinase
MTKGRLTRQELGWLLTQEAQGAAERLRVGVQVLKSNPPPAAPAGAPDLEGTGLDATLDALDDTMKMLSSLHHKPLRVTGRRGRVDVAALLWEIAPGARVSIEPGSGTEVFGDEAELRRMLQLLAGHGSGVESQVTVRREGDFVKIAVVLGPDSTATAQVERAWLERMAIRYGGSFELEGGMEIVTLPADSERADREALQKELDEARKQGEAYARELAAAFSSTEEAVTPSTFPPALSGSDVSERVAVLARFSAGVAAELRSLIGSAAKKGEAESEQRRALQAVSELAGLLETVGEIDPMEMPGPVDVREVVKNEVAERRPRAERDGVALALTDESGGGDLFARGPSRAVMLLVAEVLRHAIAASPRDGTVDVRLKRLPHERQPDHYNVRIEVEDAGPALPATSRRAFVGLELEPGTCGRPSALPLYVAAALSSWAGAAFELGDGPRGGLRVSVTFAR